MEPIAQEARADDEMRDVLVKMQAFLAVVLAERTGPLTILQRDMLESTNTAAIRAEHLLAELIVASGPPL